MSGPLLVVDSFGLIFRSHFALYSRPLTNPEGKNISAWYGFFKSVFSAVVKFQPRAVLFAMESQSPTYRSSLFPAYKQNRQVTPPELIDQIPLIEETLAAIGWPILKVEGWEADDCIASLAQRCRSEGQRLYILSGDKDLMQLVDGGVTMLKPIPSGYLEIDRDGVLSEKGVPPEAILDWLSLVGDSSDNIPGVKGIGEKTAQKLLAEYGTLDGVYAHLDAHAPALRKKLEEGRDAALLSKNLARLKADLDLGLDLEGLNLAMAWPAKAVQMFREQNATTLLSDFRVATGYQTQGELFTGKDPPHTETSVGNPAGIYKRVGGLAEWEALLSRAGSAPRVAMDTETTGTDALRERCLGFSLSFVPGEGWWMPLGGDDDGVVIQRLGSFFETPGLKIIGHNWTFDWKVLRRLGLNPPSAWFDTMAAGWLLDVNKNTYGLEDLALQHLGLRGLSYDSIVPKGKTLEDANPDLVARYAGEDADFTLRLASVLEPKLLDRGLWNLFRELEMPVLEVLAGMEWRGIRLERGELEKLGLELERGALKAEAEAHALVGHPFNLGSVRQLQEVLFEERQLKPTRKTKTGYSTDSETLEELALEDPVPALILRYRFLAKLKNTYADTLPGLIHPETGRVHTHFLITGTATGRLASKDPNLQNIPVKDEEGRAIRNAFRTNPGWTFVSADYAQIELAVLAHFSGDPELTRAFLEGQDIHRRTAALVFHVPEPDVSSAQRRAAKAVNFGIIYGMSAFRLARELGISRGEAAGIITRYFESFPSIKSWIQGVVDRARTDGFVTTLEGRQRAVPLVLSSNDTERQAGERVAVNTVIQGTAADIVKRAMLRVNKALAASGLKAALLLQVHDELLLECPLEETEALKELLRTEMEAAAGLSLPLRVSVESAARWGELH